ncbi:glycosyltransferase family 2 protein [Rhodoferax sp. U11-2br]|uniref:glycosyltransferase n=1 Tax=Rhodoferax sp. U11-2br TaxID=2838878 RepID=UPI001BE854D6|nr:glycosyltransferase family 2 protein [Rhodoferax sp. U11-2br]MBT3066092.1 glycosyltransferase family 2 protein [Rhodoferax sp. U11-2br]
MKISLIVCTKNRAPQLNTTLKKLSELQTADPWEMILVNNGSTDNSQKLLEDFCVLDPEHRKVFFEPKSGVSHAQNTGLQHATGDIIAFSDDDCYPEPDYLNTIRACFIESPIDFLGGRVLLFDPQNAAITIQTCPDRIDVHAHSYIKTGMIHGCSIAFTREAIETIGGFDPEVGPGSPLNSGNDIITLIRCSAHGYRGAYDPRPVVYHHHGRSWGHDIDRILRRYDVSRGAAYYLGLYYKTTRKAYLWPTFKHVLAQILKGRWFSLKNEILGAYLYSVVLKKRKRSGQ